MSRLITLEQLCNLACHDYDSWGEISAENWKQHGNTRWLRRTPEYIQHLADILAVSATWPFPPLQVSGSQLWNGHHRAQAAVLAQWDKPIPVTGLWFAPDSF